VQIDRGRGDPDALGHRPDGHRFLVAHL
jgi:hypothetical protein